MIPVNAQNAAEVAKAVKAGDVPGAKSLAEALARIWGRVKYVRKDKKMQGGGAYTYVSDAALIDAIRPELVIEGVIFAPVDMQVVALEVVEGRNNKQNRVVIRVTNRFTHAATGETLDVVTFGEGMDVGDKATNKAMTAAAKYCLRQTFCVETGDDPDDTPSAEQQRATTAPSLSRVKEFTDRINLAADLTALVGVYRTFDAQLKAERITPADRAAIEPLFAAAKKKFPAPAKP